MTCRLRILPAFRRGGDFAALRSAAVQFLSGQGVKGRASLVRFGAALFCAFLFMALCGPPRAHAQTDPTSPNQMGAGCAMVDYDLDGDMDLLYVNTGDGKVQVYRNGLVPDGSVSFTDVTAASGLTDRMDSAGAAWGDYDNDGDPDLFINNLRLGGPNTRNLSPGFRLQR